MNIYEMFLVMVGFHFLCDYPLQGDFLSKGKGSFVEPLHGIPWWHCNLAHAAIHGLAVGLITQSIMFGLIETFFHFCIDYCKSCKYITINQDQLLHILCKIIWVSVWIFITTK